MCCVLCHTRVLTVPLSGTQSGTHLVTEGLTQKEDILIGHIRQGSNFDYPLLN